MSQKAQCLFLLREYKKSVETWTFLLELDPTNAMARAKKKDTEKMLTKLRFEEAIHVPEMKLTQSIIDLIDEQDPVGLASYNGPKLSASLSDINMNFIKSLVSHFKDKKKIHEKYAMQIMFHALQIFSCQESLLKISFPTNAQMTICGDVHGQFDDLVNIFNLFGWPTWNSENDEGHYYLFNGDFVDRGPQSIEVILLLLSLKSLFPKSFFMARGNHESTHCNKIYGFEKEVLSKYGEDMFRLFEQVFHSIPLCHVIQERIFVTHGGLPPNPRVSLDEIKKIDRYHDPSAQGDSLMHHLLWADPREEPGAGPSARGTSISFGPDITESFLSFNRLDVLVRSHEYQEEGYKISQGGKCITIFSAPCYMNGTNKGAVINVSSDGSMKFQQF